MCSHITPGKGRRSFVLFLLISATLVSYQFIQSHTTVLTANATDPEQWSDGWKGLLERCWTASRLQVWHCKATAFPVQQRPSKESGIVSPEAGERPERGSTSRWGSDLCCLCFINWFLRLCGTQVCSPRVSEKEGRTVVCPTSQSSFICSSQVNDGADCLQWMRKTPKGHRCGSLVESLVTYCRTRTCW